jgi:hypothetical protein
LFRRPFEQRQMTQDIYGKARFLLDEEFLKVGTFD